MTLVTDKSGAKTKGNNSFMLHLTFLSKSFGPL